MQGYDQNAYQPSADGPGSVGRNPPPPVAGISFHCQCVVYDILLCDGHGLG